MLACVNIAAFCILHLTSRIPRTILIFVFYNLVLPEWPLFFAPKLTLSSYHWFNLILYHYWWWWRITHHHPSYEYLLICSPFLNLSSILLRIELNDQTTFFISPMYWTFSKLFEKRCHLCCAPRRSRGLFSFRKEMIFLKIILNWHGFDSHPFFKMHTNTCSCKCNGRISFGYIKASQPGGMSACQHPRCEEEAETIIRKS